MDFHDFMLCGAFWLLSQSLIQNIPLFLSPLGLFCFEWKKAWISKHYWAFLWSCFFLIYSAYNLLPLLLSGIITAAIALFTDLDVLLNLVSIGTLFVFYMVANAVVYRRYVATGTTNPWPTLSFLCSFSFTAIMFTLIWKFVPNGRPKAGMLSVCGVIAAAILQLFHCMVPQARKPEFWGVPLMPWIPSISIFLNVFLLGSLDGPSYVRFGFFSAVAVLFYVLYSVHASFDAEGDGSLGQKNGEIHVESRESSEEDPSLKV